MYQYSFITGGVEWHNLRLL